MPTHMVKHGDAGNYSPNLHYMPDEAPELYAAEHAADRTERLVARVPQ